jgi:hypothetical protein
MPRILDFEILLFLIQMQSMSGIEAFNPPYLLDPMAATQLKANELIF